jgi:hypothetical protein
MPLRNPVYLDLDTLAAQAQYAGVDLPVSGDVVETEIRKGSVGGSASLGPIRADGTRGRDIEIQTSYKLEPNTKAVVSSVIDGLINGGSVMRDRDTDCLSKDQLVEFVGTSRLTPASMVGKMFHLLLRTVAGSAQSVKDLNFNQLEPELLEEFKTVYFGNALLPMPLLLELSGTGSESRTFVNVEPNHFVGGAGIDRIEGEVTVLGTVAALVAEEKSLTTERWLLDGYEWLLRRVMMTNIDDVIEQVVTQFDVKFLPQEARHLIAGPAVVVDAIAIY